MLLIDTRPLARRSPLALSILLHTGLLALIPLFPADKSVESAPFVQRQHAVILLQFREAKPVAQQAGAASGRPQGSGSRGAMAALRAPVFSPSSGSPAPSGGPELPVSQPRRAFDATAALSPRPIKQTIVQFDVPPDIILKQVIPLPNIVSLPTQAPLYRRQFIALSVKNLPDKKVQNVTPAPDISLPNREPMISDLKVSSALVSNLPRLFRPPATISPVKITTSASVNQVPQIAPVNTNLADASAIISLTDSPVQPNGTVVIPPANQSASSGNAGSADHPSSSRKGAEGNGQGSQAAANAGTGAGAAGSQGSKSGFGVSGTSGSTGTDLAANVAGLGGASGNSAGRGNENGLGSKAGSGNGAGGSSSGLGASGAGTEAGRGVSGNGNGSSGDGLDSGTAPSGVTRIVLPKTGKFGVVVIGSSQAVPYPETVGALTGKMVYTVYLSVGLHKKWILQYCLSKEAERSVPKGSATPLDSPWPYLIFRPDNLAGSSDYVMVHGMINPEGRFDQLAMVFPEQLEQKELLMNSLKLWTFRPASRDHIPITVEFLLIIPSES